MRLNNDRWKTCSHSILQRSQSCTRKYPQPVCYLPQAEELMGNKNNIINSNNKHQQQQHRASQCLLVNICYQCSQSDTAANYTAITSASRQRNYVCCIVVNTECTIDTDRKSYCSYSATAIQLHLHLPFPSPIACQPTARLLSHFVLSTQSRIDHCHALCN